MNVTSSRSLALFTFLAACHLFAAGCQSPNTTDKGEQPSNPTKSQGPPIEVAPLVDQVETLRDRAFKKVPDMRAEKGPVADSTDLSEKALRERRRLARVLFGLENTEAPKPRKPAQLATYRPGDNRIDVSSEAADSAELKAAVRMALVEALDHQHFGTPSKATTWDGHLARRAADHGDRVFVAALAEESDRLDAEELAARPEVVQKLSTLESWLDIGGGDSPSMVQDADDLDRRLSAFALREGLSLAAAFHRASGWSGVELLFSRRPDSTRDVVSPNRWMSGEGLGTWSWPKDASSDAPPVVAKGRVGPALTATWVAQAVPAKLARTIYTGWTSDAYRLRRAKDQPKHWQFEWLSHWSKPHGARQIAAAFERIIQNEHKNGRSHLTGTVVRRGLKVAVVLKHSAPDQAKPEKNEELATGLLEAGIRFQPRRKMPVQFVPTRLQAYTNEMQKAELTDTSWTDPASGLDVDLKPLSDWKVRRSQTPPLRWFARGPGGALLQVSTELADPLGPEFGTDAYLKRWRSGFASSLKNAELSPVQRLSKPAEPTLSFSMEGQRKDESIRLTLWHFLRDDVLVTVSLQGPTGSFKDVEPVATAVLSGITLDRETAGDDTSDKGGNGHIEYEIESE
jgi:hypothetical protein